MALSNLLEEPAKGELWLPPLHVPQPQATAPVPPLTPATSPTPPLQLATPDSTPMMSSDPTSVLPPTVPVPVLTQALPVLWPAFLMTSSIPVPIPAQTLPVPRPALVIILQFQFLFLPKYFQNRSQVSLLSQHIQDLTLCQYPRDYLNLP